MKPALIFALFLCAVHISSAQSMKPVMTSHIPATGATNVPTYIPLSITFNKFIAKGAWGNIYLRIKGRTGATIISVASPSVSITDSNLYISGLVMESGADYYVTYDAGTVESGGFQCDGLSDPNVWWFRTAGVPQGITSTRTASFPFSLLNPSSNGLFVLSCGLPQAGMVNLSVYDLAGRVVACRSFTGMAGENELRLQTTAPAGMYLVRIDYGGMRATTKAIMR
jgi:hypothetical protein